MLSADQTRARWTARLPAHVVTTMGYRHSRKTSATFDRLPRPSRKTKSGKSAILGIGYVPENRGSRTLAATVERPIRTPSATPTTAARANPASAR
jgi:hypothetical protein